MTLSIGSKAPDFLLYDSDKELVSLNKYLGQNVLLLFFPFAFSRVCTAELCQIRDDFTLYNSLKTDVLGISVDSLYCLAKFKEDQKINFTLLSDFNKHTSAAYGALYQNFNYNMQGVSKRAAFIVNDLGNIAYAEVLEEASQQPDFQQIEKYLKGKK